MTQTLALAIPTLAKFNPERMASLRRLLGALGLWDHMDRLVNGETVEPYLSEGGKAWAAVRARLFLDKEPNAVWSEKLWTWALESGCDHLVQLQDDVEIMPVSWWDALRDMIHAFPHEIIGLETAHELADYVTQRGDAWCTTNEGLVGVGYVLPREVLAEFLEWRETGLKDDARSTITEDTQLGLFALATGRKVYHPCPTIIDHDVSIASTYGNDAHTRRKPSTTWKSPSAARTLRTGVAGVWSTANERVPHLGGFYGEGLIELARRSLVDWSEDIARRAAERDGSRDQRKLARWVQDQLPELPYRVLIATPIRDASVSAAHEDAVVNAIMVSLCDVKRLGDILGTLRRDADVVLTRSRLARAFYGSSATDLWFIDADVAPSAEILAGMLRSRQAGNDGILCCPYARRDSLNLPRVLVGHAMDPKAPLEAHAYAFSMGLSPDQIRKNWTLENDCAPVEWGPLGCTLIPRSAIERMRDYARGARERRREINESFIHEHAKTPLSELEPWLEKLYQANSQHREDELFCDDLDGGRWVETFLPFMLRVAPNSESISTPGFKFRKYLSEDQAFCSLAKRAGVGVYAYFGPGAPAPHIGTHVFQGAIEAFGLERTARKAP